MLEMLGAAFLVLLGCALASFVGGLLWLRIQMKSTSLVSALAETLNDVPVPSLSPTLSLDWHHELEAGELCRLYMERSAKFVGDYTIFEVDETRVRALYLESPPAFLVINDHRDLGCWTDMIMLPTGGGSLTFTTVPESRDDSVKPFNHEMVQIDMSTHPDSMIGFARSRLLGGSFEAVNPANFEALFDEIMLAYHKVLETADVDQAWLESLAKESGVVLSGSEASIINSERQIARSEDVVSACLQSYAESSGMSALQWEQQRHSLLVIHDDLPAQSLVELLWQTMEIPESLESELVSLESADGTCRTLTRAFNSRLPEALQMTKIATVMTPVVADIYQIELQSDIARAA